MKTVLVIGGTRGLGASLISQYSQSSSPVSIAATARSDPPKSAAQDKTAWVRGIDLTDSDCGEKLVSGLKKTDIKTVDVLIISAGLFGKESFDSPDWASEVKMYTTSSVAPVFLVSALVKAGFLSKGSKVILVTSESGSLTLRHEKEGGGNYAHHASKAALNMAGKLLSFDLKEKEVAVALVHPGFMRTEMTKGVGFDKFYDEGGAVTPDEAAASLKQWIDDKFDMSLTGTYWAPRGPRDIGNIELTVGDNLPTPLQLPW